MNQKELTERWEKTGLLDGLDDFNKNECASSLQEATELLLGEMEDYYKEVDKVMGYDGFLAGTFLPIVRRLYSDGVLSERIHHMRLAFLLQDFGSFAMKRVELFKDLMSGLVQDGEAQLVDLYMKGLIEAVKEV